VIESGHDDPDHLQRPAAEAIRNADVIIHTQGESPAVLSLARREVELLAVGPRAQRRLADDRLARGLDVVILTDNGMKSAGSSGIPA
jgi:siroheme synthase